MASWGFLAKQVVLTIKNGTFFEHVFVALRGFLCFYWLKRMLVNYWRKRYWTSIDNKKIVFCNFFGKGYGCNPKYIAEELLRRGVDCKLVWLVKDEYAKKSLPPGIKTVKYFSLASFKELMTAKIWVNNQPFSDYIQYGLQKKSGQFYVQTFHGSLGIKKVGEERTDVDKSIFCSVRKDAELIDILVANSQFEADTVYRPRFYGFGEICMVGHPRNDVFFANDKALRRLKIKKMLGIAAEKNIAIYVPTFRNLENLDCYKLDYDRAVSALKKRFGGDWAFLVRLHPIMAHGLRKKLLKKENVLDVTSYSDVYELLLVADCCITDYSSAIFDYMLGDGFGFIFAKDYESYATDRGFYYPLSATPFPVAVNNDELEQNILNFDIESYQKNVQSFLAGKGCIEDGKASSRVVDMIEEKLKEI